MKQIMPKGMQDFLDKIHGLDKCNPVVTCHICGKDMPVNEMSVFTYPDKPTYTTVSVCAEDALKLANKYRGKTITDN